MSEVFLFCQGSAQQFQQTTTRHIKDRFATGRQLVISFLVLLASVTLLGLLSTLPASAVNYYSMVVTNSTGATLYLYPAPWDNVLPTQSSCMDLVGGLGVQQTIPAGGSTTLFFNRSGQCSSLQGWLSLRASHNPGSTGTDYQQFWFDDDDGDLTKHGLMSTYQNQLVGGSWSYALNVLTATDSGHDFQRYGYRMAVKNTSGKPIWVFAAPDNQDVYGHARSSCITPNSAAPFGHSYQVQNGQTQNFYFSRSEECSSLQGYFSIRASAEQNTDSVDFQQFEFDNEGSLFKSGIIATWPNSLEYISNGHYSLNVAGAEYAGGYNFRNYGYQLPEYADWPGLNAITPKVGTWDDRRHEATLTWRTKGLPVGRYTDCRDISFGFELKYYHTQYMVQLPSKNGRAYFARTDSFRNLGSFYVVGTDADAYDPANDYVIDTPGTDGEVVFLEQYSDNSPIGDWNHPGDMSVVGDILVIAGQQWHSREAAGSAWYVCGEFSGPPGTFLLGPKYIYDKNEGIDADAALFYDVSDPENPKYLGKISEAEIGFGGNDAISAVTLSKTTNGLWDLMIGGNSGTKHFRTKYLGQKPWPTVDIWEEYNNEFEQSTRAINSYENNEERLRHYSFPGDGPRGFDLSTIRFLGPTPSYDLASDTTGTKNEDPKYNLPGLRLDCKEGGGSASVSESGSVHIDCPFLGSPIAPGVGDCYDGVNPGEACIGSYHYSMPDVNLSAGCADDSDAGRWGDQCPHCDGPHLVRRR